ncbi:MAG: cupin domain-containing protein [Alphaproteobacteria bacterium]
MAEVAEGDERPDSELIATLEAAHLHPLWDRYKTITPVHPQATDASFLWRWRDMEPLTARAASEVPAEDVERRAIIMCNPAFGGQTITTGNLIAAFTVLEPGDRSPPHRHTAAAIRFATRAEGAVTIVNGRRCEMSEGDLILTPPMCWHGHINESDHRIVWFDSANMPLIKALDANFFEPGNRGDNAFWQVDEGEERIWTAAGLVAADIRHRASHSPKYRYPGKETRRMLACVEPGPDGARALRFVNPLTGGPVMSTLDCYAMRLAEGAATRPKRATYNVVCLVVAGEGRSTVGEETFEWSRHDVFTVPHWSWACHEASSGEADLFMVTDRAVHERLDLVREELR